jgi:FtsP/CotA-like multicopper oxidase with cupredoxin domain
MFENRLPLTEFCIVSEPTHITLNIQARQAMLSDNPALTPMDANCWRYIVTDTDGQILGTRENNAHVLNVNLGPILNVRRGQPLKVSWINELVSMQDQPPMGSCAPPLPSDAGRLLQMPPINPPAMDSSMNPSVGVVTHLHGGKVQHGSDGWPKEPISFPGNPYAFPTHRQYHYPNDQRSVLLWFHDHGMDNTAPQAHAGLAGLYFIRDEGDDAIFTLLGGLWQDLAIDGKPVLDEQGNPVKELMELPLVLQDRVFDCDFTKVDYAAGMPGLGDPYSRSEFLGDTIFVNGRPWPHHEVRQKAYRLRIVNGSNARTYALALIDPNPWSAPNPAARPQIWHSDLLTVIGNDGGLFAQAKPLQATGYVLIAPGERLDLILDLTHVCPHETTKLRLVNLAVNSARNDNGPEAIFQTENPITDGSGNTLVGSSLLPAPNDEFDPGLLLALSSIKQANILQFCIVHSTPGCQCEAAAPPPGQDLRSRLGAVLGRYAVEDGFHDNNGVLEPVPANAPIACNRLVLLMNDTCKLAGTDPATQQPTKSPQTNSRWKDTQIWEMAPSAGAGHGFNLPFNVDLTSANPAPVDFTKTAQTGYKVQRATFFETDPPAWLITDPAHNKYAPLHKPSFKPKAGSYERWYVANVGNQQPLTVASIAGSANVPDMHPFHMHLVNFVVLRRFALDGATNTFQAVSNNNTWDASVRHDTVRVQSNQLLELLVYFPPAYEGIYPYHCHLVEHEDMGMMLHFETV